jgi:hypothetical protein
LKWSKVSQEIAKESAQEGESQEKKAKKAKRSQTKTSGRRASFKARLPNLGRASSSGVKNPMTGQRTPVRRAEGGINSEPADVDNVAEAIDQVSREVQAARRDVGVTSFCLQQAEALRRIDRAKASIADLVQSRNRENKHS